MDKTVEIKVSDSNDVSTIGQIYAETFPDEELLPLTQSLLSREDDVFAFSAMHSGRLVGHIVFTECQVAGSAERPALLGPLAVQADVQGLGIGSQLVETGMRMIKAMGMTYVLVLGDPRYYGRFGMAAETGVMPPFPLPEAWRAAWQSKRLQGEETPLRGRLLVPAPWMDDALWRDA